MKKIIFILFFIFISACHSKNEFKDYYTFLSYIDKFNFENLENISYDLKLNDEIVKSSLSLNEENIYVFNFENYKSFYIDGVNYIDDGKDKYFKNVLRNAYINMLEKHMHINFNEIPLTGINKLEKINNGYKLYLNDAGILLYANDILKRNNAYIEKPEYISGDGFIEVKEIDNVIYLKSNLFVKCKNKEFYIEENINTEKLENVSFDKKEY